MGINHLQPEAPFVMRYKTSTALFSLAVASSLVGSLAEPVRVLDRDFPDPSITQTPDGWYSFGTTSGGRNVQVAHSTDFVAWEFLEDHDALPGLPEWVADEPMVWAPDVIQQDDGRYIMYYARIREDVDRHYLGVATSSAIEGRYCPVEHPLACPIEQGGAIDAAGFKDDDGTVYVTYKVDGSRLTTDDGEVHPTPLVLQEVKGDGFTPVGEPVTLLDRTHEDGPLIEAPVIVKSDGFYYLFFSSHLFNNPDYDSKYATAPSVAGPYTRKGRVVAPGDPSSVGPLSGPGGADITEDGTKFVFHANLDNESPAGGRGLYATAVTLAGGKSFFRT
ncbi:glycoside hydrolase family 43 protein [Aspergillus undulatus]|uniref:glycoside hydrolase family 43 protein n=1 Tax=Aspergillus undulatus TaxID=1810928 RepID=UPI003CCDEB5C